MKAANLIITALLSVVMIFCNSTREGSKQSDDDYYVDGYYWDLDNAAQNEAQENYYGKLPEVYKVTLKIGKYTKDTSTTGQSLTVNDSILTNGDYPIEVAVVRQSSEPYVIQVTVIGEKTYWEYSVNLMKDETNYSNVKDMIRLKGKTYICIHITKQ